MFTIYVLYSQKYNEIYIGFTSDLENRFLSRNELATKGHTIKYRSWVIAYTDEYQTKAGTMKRGRLLQVGVPLYRYYRIYSQICIAISGRVIASKLRLTLFPPLYS